MLMVYPGNKILVAHHEWKTVKCNIQSAGACNFKPYDF